MSSSSSSSHHNASWQQQQQQQQQYIGKEEPFEQRVVYVREWFDPIGIDTDAPPVAVTNALGSAQNAQARLQGMAVRIEPFAVANCGEGQRQMRVGADLASGRVVDNNNTAATNMISQAKLLTGISMDNVMNFEDLSVNANAVQAKDKLLQQHCKQTQAVEESSGTLAATQIMASHKHLMSTNSTPSAAVASLASESSETAAQVVHEQARNNGNTPVALTSTTIRITTATTPTTTEAQKTEFAIRRPLVRRRRGVSLDGVVSTSHKNEFWSQFYSPFSHQHRTLGRPDGVGVVGSTRSTSVSRDDWGGCSNNNNNNDSKNNSNHARFISTTDRNNNSNSKDNRGACLRRARLRSAASEGDLAALCFAVQKQAQVVDNSVDDDQQTTQSITDQEGRGIGAHRRRKQYDRRLTGAKRSNSGNDVVGGEVYAAARASRIKTTEIDDATVTATADTDDDADAATSAADRHTGRRLAQVERDYYEYNTHRRQNKRSQPSGDIGCNTNTNTNANADKSCSAGDIRDTSIATAAATAAVRPCLSLVTRENEEDVGGGGAAVAGSERLKTSRHMLESPKTRRRRVDSPTCDRKCLT